MKQLISYKGLRILRIVEMLIVKKEIITFDEIRILNDCSRQTVIDDINYIHKRWNSIINFEINKNSLECTNRSIHDLIFVKSEIYRSEIKIQLLLGVFMQPNLSINDLSVVLNYSVSHLRRQITPLNLYLRNYDCKITFNSATDGYYLASENEILCSMLLMELMDISKSNSLLTNSFINNDFNLKDLFINITLPIPERTQINMKNFIQIASIRSDGGFFTESHIEIIEASYSICNSLFKYFLYEANSYARKLGVTLSPQNRQRIAIVLSTVANKAMFLTGNIDNHMNRYDYFYKSFKIRKPETAAIFEEHMASMDLKYNTNFMRFLSELAFHLYTNVNILNHVNISNMAVYSDFGDSHRESLIEGISEHFPRHNVSRYNPDLNYDIIISTKDLPHISKKCTVVKISDFINIRDLAAIYNALYVENSFETSQLTPQFKTPLIPQ